MSRSARGIEVRERVRTDGSTARSFRVRYPDPGTGGRRWKTFATMDEALDFQAKVRLLQRRGDLAELSRGSERLSEFIPLWWTDYATVALADVTLRNYRTLLYLHAIPRLGALELRQFTPQVVDQFRAELEREGVGPASIYRTMSILQGVFSRAVAWGYLPVNPFDHARKPPARRARTVELVTPRQVEAIREQMVVAADHQSATLVSVLAYAGLRPQEALALQWRHVGKTTLLVEQKDVDGQIVPGQKTSRRARSVVLLDHLRRDLSEQRMRCGRPDGEALVFPRKDRPWRDHDWRNWRRRIYAPAALAAGLKTPRPYDLRHSFASLMLQDGSVSHVELADQLGHGVETLWSTYAHAIKELRGQAGVPADELIAAARAGREPAAESAAAN